MSVDFDRKAKTWEDDTKRVRGQYFAKEISERIVLQPSWQLVEFGAGTGAVGRQLSEQVESITLVDSSAEMLNVAQAFCKAEGRNNVSTVHSKLAEYSADHPGTADVVLAVMVLHHIVDPTVAVQQLVNVAKPGGYICIIDLHENDGSFHRDVEGFDGHNGFNLKSLEHRFAELNCQTVYADTILNAEQITSHGKTPFSQFLLVVQAATN